MTEPTDALLPCPFCGAGQTYIHVNKGPWNGRGYGEPVSVEVRHWCADIPGQLSRMIAVAGRDESSAIAAWNRRTPQPTQEIDWIGASCHHLLQPPTQAQAGAVPLTDEQKQHIHNETVASHALICLVESYLLEAHGIKGGQHGADT